MTNSPQSCSAASEGLKPCPFCGSDTFMSNTETCWVRCINHDCCAEGPTADSEWQAAAMWNKRTGDAAQPAPEPVAWRYKDNGDEGWLLTYDKPTAPWDQIEALYNAAQPPAAPVKTKPDWCMGADGVCHFPACACVYAAPAAPVETISDEGVIKAAGAMVRLGQERRKLEAPMPTRGEEARACIETYLAFLRANSPTQCSAATEQATGRYEFPYNRTFQAIAAATSVYAEGVGVNVSVKAFQEAFNSFPDARPLNEPQEVQVLDFFSQSVDAWGALEWFDRLAKAVREQDKAVVAGDMITMETCRNVASSSAMRLVRDYEPLVRAALALTRPHGGGK